jgi:hypothetical protein
MRCEPAKVWTVEGVLSAPPLPLKPTEMTEIDQSLVAVKQLSAAVKFLKETGVIRSRRFTGDIGEWYVEQLYNAQRPTSQTQKGWDLILPATGERLQVKTQSFDQRNRWNYLESENTLFDRLIVVILTESFGLRNIYDVPAAELTAIIRVGKENKPYYHWDDLIRWQIDPESLPGFIKVKDLIEVHHL